MKKIYILVLSLIMFSNLCMAHVCRYRTPKQHGYAMDRLPAFTPCPSEPIREKDRAYFDSFKEKKLSGYKFYEAIIIDLCNYYEINQSFPISDFVMKHIFYYIALFDPDVDRFAMRSCEDKNLDGTQLGDPFCTLRIIQTYRYLSLKWMQDALKYYSDTGETLFERENKMADVIHVDEQQKVEKEWAERESKFDELTKKLGDLREKAYLHDGAL
jgi:hypothetical protein